MEQRRARLPQFIDPVPEQKKNPNYELKNIAMKSYRKRSISQAHNKKLHSGDKIDILDSRNGDRIMRVGPAFNQIKFPTQRRIRQNVHPYKGY